MWQCMHNTQHTLLNNRAKLNRQSESKQKHRHCCCCCCCFIVVGVGAAWRLDATADDAAASACMRTYCLREHSIHTCVRAMCEFTLSCCVNGWRRPEETVPQLNPSVRIGHILIMHIVCYMFLFYRGYNFAWLLRHAMVHTQTLTGWHTLVLINQLSTVISSFERVSCSARERGRERVAAALASGRR